MNYPEFGSKSASKSSRNEVLPLALALLTTFYLLVSVGWLGLSHLRNVSMGAGVGPQDSDRAKASGPGSISIGDRLLLPDEGGDRAPAMFYPRKVA